MAFWEAGDAPFSPSFAGDVSFAVPLEGVSASFAPVVSRFVADFTDLEGDDPSFVEEEAWLFSVPPFALPEDVAPSAAWAPEGSTPPITRHIPRSPVQMKFLYPFINTSNRRFLSCERCAESRSHEQVVLAFLLRHSSRFESFPLREGSKEGEKNACGSRGKNV